MTHHAEGSPDHRPEHLAVMSAPGWLLRHGHHIDSISGLTEEQIKQMVDLDYDGGWESFVDHVTSVHYDRDPDDIRRTGTVGITAARAWLTDSGFTPETIAELFDWQVARLLNRIYDGGWTAFMGAIAITGRQHDPRTLPAPTATSADSADTRNGTVSQLSFTVAESAVLGVLHHPIPE